MFVTILCAGYMARMRKPSAYKISRCAAGRARWRGLARSDLFQRLHAQESQRVLKDRPESLDHGKPCVPEARVGLPVDLDRLVELAESGRERMGVGRYFLWREIVLCL